MAFAVTFSSLLLAGIIWMSVWLGIGGADTTPPNVVAQWLSPDGISGWLIYVGLTCCCFWPLAKWAGILKPSEKPPENTID